MSADGEKNFADWMIAEAKAKAKATREVVAMRAALTGERVPLCPDCPYLHGHNGRYRPKPRGIWRYIMPRKKCCDPTTEGVNARTSQPQGSDR